MLRFNKLVCAVVVCAFVGVAFGAAVKIKCFDYLAEPNLDADGMAILNYVQGQGETILQLVVSDFEPDRDCDWLEGPCTESNVAYDVVLRKPGGDCQVSGQCVEMFKMLKTDQHGHGTLHWTLHPFYDNFTDADVEIYVGYKQTGIPEVLRAIGYNPG
jgi:hypothetical protein